MKTVEFQDTLLSSVCDQIQNSVNGVAKYEKRNVSSFEQLKTEAVEFFGDDPANKDQISFGIMCEIDVVLNA